MAFLRCDFHSLVLDQQTSMSVILPEAYKPDGSIPGNPIKKGFPVLYLLHGYNGDETVWQRFTSLERYITKYPLAVVMPRGNHGFYVNHLNNGYQYLEFITGELPEKVAHFFNVSTKAEDTFIAGLSMGGYGAYRCVIEKPAQYAAVAAMSPAIDFKAFYDSGTMRIHGAHATGGSYESALAKGDVILDRLARHLEAGVALPPFYLSCGTEDYLYEHSRLFKAFCEERGLNLTYEEWPGIHDYVFWDAAIEKILAWLPIKPRDITDQDS